MMNLGLLLPESNAERLSKMRHLVLMISVHVLWTMCVSFVCLWEGISTLFFNDE